MGILRYVESILDPRNNESLDVYLSLLKKDNILNEVIGRPFSEIILTYSITVFACTKELFFPRIRFKEDEKLFASPNISKKAQHCMLLITKQVIIGLRCIVNSVL